MKELSIEEKAKRYDKAIERAKDYKNDTIHRQLKVGENIMDYIFPELKESENWIPKEIIKYLKEKGDFRSCWIAWLEKQGEQKPTVEMKTPEESLGIDSDTYNKIVDECVYGEQKSTKVEPKFKVGDKIYLKPEYRMPDDDTPIANTVFEIRAIDDKHYRFDGSYIFIEDQDKYELDNTIKFIEDRVAATSPSLRTYSPTLTGKEIPFLKALKDRVQPKQEWSEEDNRMSRFIGNAITVDDASIYLESKGIQVIDAHVWLNGLKDRYAWRPSDEQMEVLNEVIRNPYLSTAEYNGLIALREQFKAL